MNPHKWRDKSLFVANARVYSDKSFHKILTGLGLFDLRFSNAALAAIQSFSSACFSFASALSFLSSLIFIDKTRTR